jgi:hypothetical protein
LDRQYLTRAQALPTFKPKYCLDCLTQYADMSLSFGVLDASWRERDRTKAWHAI